MMLPEYSGWLEKQDQAPAYEYMRKLLLLLQWQKGGKSEAATHWILKTPHHLEWLDTLVTIFPQSKIIHTYRDPLTTLPSLLSMLYHGMKLFSDDVNPVERVPRDNIPVSRDGAADNIVRPILDQDPVSRKGKGTVRHPSSAGGIGPGPQLVEQHERPLGRAREDLRHAADV